jgi:hypothetical protein
VRTILLVGPDGTGKSSLAALLAQRLGTGVRRSHYRPGSSISCPPPTSDPHADPPRSVPASMAKLLILWLEQWYHEVRSRASREFLLMERGYWDQVVDPARYRLAPRSVALVTPLGRLLPRPHLVVLLTGPPLLVHTRKPELSVGEIDRQIECWRRILPAVGRHRIELDVRPPLPELVDRVERALGDV